jgi:microsomal dipeptidase-like Zn-dependent dipeptidase
MGAAHVAMGTDFDGAADRVEGLRRVEDMPRLWARLAETGMETAPLEGVAWKNALEFLKRSL